ncbi:DUF4401 domain-containing protein [Sphingobacterium deserti]|uniref:Putative permease n=1 Tax=Sphingobacterium deserti TaxID=1229276 RepID=A0A0B8T042_9SPHI|nr:DUF4401 domain-containing protein [Sphingobacterium deserti]KGE13491.1 putative permease [Sphingobacterium deserti]
MERKNKIDQIVNYFQSTNGEAIELDRVAIDRAYSNPNGKQTLTIKVLSVFGGLLASFVFFGFLFFTGLYGSETALLIFSALAIAIGLIVSREDTGILWDTMSVTALIIGFIMLAAGLNGWQLDTKHIPLVLTLLAAACVALAGNYIACFISTLILHGSVLAYIIANHSDYLALLYLFILIGLLCYLFLYEATLITRRKSVAKWYNPVKTALIFAFFSGLIVLRENSTFSIDTHSVFYVSALCIVFILYLAKGVLERFRIEKNGYVILTYFLILMTLIPTAFAPGITGALLVLLLCFQTNYKTGFVIAAIALIYFIGQCYYDLQFTLLAKSLLLFASGIFFIIIYLFISKRHDQHKKV